MQGLMQHRELVIPHIIDYAARWHGEQVKLHLLARPTTASTDNWLDPCSMLFINHICIAQNPPGAVHMLSCSVWDHQHSASAGGCHFVGGRRHRDVHLRGPAQAQPALRAGAAEARRQVCAPAACLHSPCIGLGCMMAVLIDCLHPRAGDIVATMAWNTTRHLEVRLSTRVFMSLVRSTLPEC